MNDFTKGELQEIYGVFDRQGACRLLDLKSKIQVMIDTYCDKSKCNNCGQIREGKYEDDFFNNGHWTDGGVFCGQWRK